MDVVTEGLGTSSHLCNVLQFFFFLSISVFGTHDGGRRENGTQEKTVRSWPEVCRRGSSRWSGQTPNTARDFAKMSSLRRCLLSPPVYYLWTSERDQLGAHFSGKRRAPVLPPFLPVFGNTHCTAAQPSRRLNTKLYLDQAIIVFELRVLCGIVVCRKISKQSNNLKT